VITGFVALGKLAATNAQNPELANLVSQILVNVSASADVVNLTLDFPLDLLDKLEQLKGSLPKKVV
jgi:hypothetical protein